MTRHRSRGRFVPPPAVLRFLRGRAPLVSLLPVVLAVLVVQSSSPAAQRMPSGVARFDLAAAWALSVPGGLDGYGAWLARPPLGRLQYGLLLRLLQGGDAQSVLAAAHGTALLLAVLQTALVWLLVRRSGGSALAAGFAGVLLGIAPIAVQVHTQVSAAAVAVVWALLAAVLVTGRRQVGRAIGGVCAAVAIASAPIVAVPLAAVATVLVLARPGAGRRALLLPLAGLAAGLALLAAGSALLAARPPGAAASTAAAVVAAERAAPAAGGAALGRWLQVDPVSAAVVVVALVVLLVSRRSLTVAAAALVLVAAAVWPLGADAVTPVVVLLPVAALATAVVVDRAVVALGHPVLARSVVGAAWLTGLAALGLVAAVGWAAGLGGLVPSRAQPVAQVERWLRSSVPNGQVVLVDLASWPDLASGGGRDVGWYATAAGRATPASSRPWSSADYVVADADLGTGTGAAAEVLARARSVAGFGTGAARLAVLAVPQQESAPTTTTPTTAAARRAQAYREQVGAQLAENDRIRVGAQGRAALLAGHVDARVVLALAQFVTAHRVTVAAFTTAPGDTSGVRTSVLISAVDGRRIPADGTRTGALLQFLSALRGDFATSSIDATDEGVIATFASAPDAVPGG